MGAMKCRSRLPSKAVAASAQWTVRTVAFGESVAAGPIAMIRFAATCNLTQSRWSWIDCFLNNVGCSGRRIGFTESRRDRPAIGSHRFAVQHLAEFPGQLRIVTQPDTASELFDSRCIVKLIKR